MDPNFESIPSTMYKYHSQTDKVLKMERIFITPKQADNEDDEEEPIETESEDEDVVPKESYLEALDHLLKPGEIPPRVLTGSDILKPEEFQTFFRPKLNLDGEEESEARIESMETNDNNERSEANEDEASGSEPTDVSVIHTKVETIKQEQQ